MKKLFSLASIAMLLAIANDVDAQQTAARYDCLPLRTNEAMAQEASAVWKPLKATEYAYDKDSKTWYPLFNYTYTYDQCGNKQTASMEGVRGSYTEGQNSKDVYEYDSNGHMVKDTYYTDGSPLKQTEYCYDDPNHPDLYTGSQVRRYNGNGAWGDISEYKNRYIATYDTDDKRLTNIEQKDGKVTNLFSYNTEYSYDDAGKLVNVLKGNGDGYYLYQVQYIDMNKTNNCIYDADKVFFRDLQLDEDNDNLLNSACIRVIEGSDINHDIITWNINVDYDGRGGYTRTAKSMFSAHITIKTIDKNGTENYSYAEYEDDNGNKKYEEREKRMYSEVTIKNIAGKRVQTEYYTYEKATQKYTHITTKYNKYGEKTSEKRESPYYNVEDIYTYEYDNNTGVLKSYTYQTKRTNQSAPTITTMVKRMVYSDIKNVTSGIDIPQASSSAISAVYNPQGVYMGTTTDELPAGVYIVKQGGETYKTLKR